MTSPSTSASRALTGRTRAAWSLADQVVVSGKNLVVLLVVIRETDAATTGAFGLVYAAYFLALALVRGVAGDPLVIRHSGDTGDELRTAGRRSMAAAVLVSVAVGGLLALPLLVADGMVWTALGVLGCGLPFLLAQDHLRLILYAGGRPDKATVNDLVTAAATCSVLLALVVGDVLSLPAVVVAWAATSLPGLLVGWLQTHVAPAVRGAVGWLREHRDLGPAFAADALANRGSEQLVNVAVAGLGSLGMLGAVTASRTLFAPLTTVQTGVNTWIIPELAARRRAGDLSGAGAQIARVAAALAGAMLATGALLALVPDPWGELLFADNWHTAMSVLLPMTVFSAVNAVSFAYWAALKALSEARGILMARTVGGVTGAAAAAVGAAAQGASSASWGMTLGALVTAVWLARDFTRRLDHEDR